MHYKISLFYSGTAKRRGKHACVCCCYCKLSMHHMHSKNDHSNDTMKICLLWFFGDTLQCAVRPCRYVFCLENCCQSAAAGSSVCVRHSHLEIKKNEKDNNTCATSESLRLLIFIQAAEDATFEHCIHTKNCSNRHNIKVLNDRLPLDLFRLPTRIMRAVPHNSVLLPCPNTYGQGLIEFNCAQIWNATPNHIKVKSDFAPSFKTFLLGH